MFRLDHIGIIVEKLEPMVELYCELLDFPPDKVEYHDVESEGVRIAMLKGNTTLEFLQPVKDDSALMKFLEKRGGGFHHFCFGANAPLQEKLNRLKEKDYRLLDDKPRQGAEGKVFFVHPKSSGGILTEFVENE